MQDVEREKSMQIGFVDEIGENERVSQISGVSFFDPPLAEEDLSFRSSSRIRQELIDSHLGNRINPTQESDVSNLLS